MNARSAPAALQILHIEDSATDHLLVKFALKSSHMLCHIRRVETLADLDACLQTMPYDLILADYHLPGFNAMEAWDHVRQLASPPPFVILSGAIGEEAAVEAMRLGVSDYVMKDNLGKLPLVMSRAIDNRRAVQERLNAEQALALSRQHLAELTAHLQTSIEHERASIAREIHDDIGGALTAIKFDLAWISRHTQDAQVLAHARAAAETLQHAIGASQRIMLNLRPAILDQGLIPALQWLVSEFERRTGIRTVFRATGEQIQADNTIQLVAFRTVQEALTNITKYAQCTRTSVDVSDQQGVLMVEITDNGTGFCVDTAAAPLHFGLRGLKERARTVGGWLDVSSQPGEGTAIILTIPLSPESSPPSPAETDP